MKIYPLQAIMKFIIGFSIKLYIFPYQNMEICTTVHILDQRHDQAHANRPLKRATLDVEMWLYAANVNNDIKIIVDICSYLFNSLFTGKYLVISLCDWNYNHYCDTFWSYQDSTSYILWGWSITLFYRYNDYNVIHRR